MDQNDSDPSKIGSTDFKESESKDDSGSIASKNYSRRDFLKLVGLGAGY